MRYFIYCRKSSEAEDRQVASIESQLTTLEKTFGNKPGIQIVGIYQEAFSAKAPGRLRFNEMLRQIEQGVADGIIAWAPDRLARNSVDGGRIIYLLDRGVVRDLKFATYTFENNSQGKFMLQIMFGQSKYYSDALSDNVKRGNQTKLEKGWRPNKPPIGYLNDSSTRTIVKDPERFPKIRTIFELMLSEQYSPSQIWRIARYEWDFRTVRRRRVGGRPIAPSYVYKILANPFYAGVLLWNGRSYRGAHEPVVSWHEFQRVQQLLAKTEKPRPITRHFTFTGMIRCGECGFMVTAERKVNRFGSRYTYYHCSKRRLDYRCRQPSVAADALDQQIVDFLAGIAIPDRIEQWIIKNLTTVHEQQQDAIEERRKALQSALERTESALENLIAMRARSLITDNEFLRERGQLEKSELHTRQELEGLEKTHAPFEPLENVISFRNKAIEWFRAGDDEAKRLIFSIVGSNPILSDKILHVEAKKPFRLMLAGRNFPKLRAFREDVRTSWLRRDPELVDILAGIEKLEIKLGIRLISDQQNARHQAA